MGQESNIVELTEAWVRGTLDSDQAQAFKKQLDSDKKFKDEVDQIKELIIGIEYNGQKRIKVKLNDIQDKYINNELRLVKPNNKKTPQKFIIKIVSIAASLALILSCFMFFGGNNKNFDAQLAFNKYYQPEIKILIGVLDDLNSSGFANPSKTENIALSEALSFYQKYNYEKARLSLSGFLKVNPDNDLANFYMGLTQLQLANYAEAIKYLKPLTSNEFEHNNTVKWYLGMCYTQTEGKSGYTAAIKLFEALASETNSEYNKEAKEYLLLIKKDSKN